MKTVERYSQKYRCVASSEPGGGSVDYSEDKRDKLDGRLETTCILLNRNTEGGINSTCNYLWREKESVSHINVEKRYWSTPSGKAEYAVDVTVQTMPDGKIPKELSDLLSELGFKKKKSS